MAYEIRLRKKNPGKKPGPVVGKLGTYATQAAAKTDAQRLADSGTFKKGIQVTVEKKTNPKRKNPRKVISHRGAYRITRDGTGYNVEQRVTDDPSHGYERISHFSGTGALDRARNKITTLLTRRRRLTNRGVIPGFTVKKPVRIKLRAGGLGGSGYLSKSAAARHSILAGVVKRESYATAFRRVNALAVLGKNRLSQAQKKKLQADMNWLRKTYR